MSYAKQYELGLAGLALLRNRLIGDEKTTQGVLNEMQRFTKTTKNVLSSISRVKLYSVSAGYKSWAATYDSIPNLLIEIEEPVVKSLLKGFSHGKVLDAACGTGRYSDFLHSLGHEVIGVDCSLAMLDYAKTRNPKIKFIKGDIRKLPFDNNNFDLAICALVLTHFSNINSALTELSRVVRPGGYLIISDIHPWFVVLGGQAEFRDKTGKRGYIYNYIHWHSTYLQSFFQTGFKVLECLEPTISQEHLKFDQTDFDLSAKTIRSALLGLPIAVVWVLEKSITRK